MVQEGAGAQVADHLNVVGLRAQAQHLRVKADGDAQLLVAPGHQQDRIAARAGVVGLLGLEDVQHLLLQARHVRREDVDIGAEIRRRPSHERGQQQGAEKERSHMLTATTIRK